LLGQNNRLLLLFLGFLSSPVLFDLLDCLGSHLELVLITVADFVLSWRGVDALEVLFTAFHTSSVVGIVDSVLVLECVEEAIFSFSTTLHHLENETIAKAITTIICALCWHGLRFRLTPALIVNVF
jgi:hypothetical protein